MTDRPDEETTGTTTGKSGKGRQRVRPVVDLPAEAVQEIPAVEPNPEPGRENAPDASVTPQSGLEEPPVSPVPPEPVPQTEPLSETLPPEKSPPSRWVPALAGLVAGLVGGVVASQVAPAVFSAAPATDAALVGRVAQLEQQARATRPEAPIPSVVTQKLQQLDGLLSELPKREAALKEDIAALRQALESRPVGIAGQPADLDTLKSRIGAVEEGVRALPQGVNQLGAKVDALQPRLDAAVRDLQGLAGRVSGLGARDALSGANARLAAVSLAEDAFAKYRRLAPALDLFRSLLPDAAVFSALEPFAEKGPESPAELVAALRAATPKAAPTGSASEGSWLERVRQSALSFVEIRKSGDVSGADDQSALKRAEQAVQRGDLASALAAIARLSPAMAPAFANWRGTVERQIKGREALAHLRTEALAHLAQTAQAAK